MNYERGIPQHRCKSAAAVRVLQKTHDICPRLSRISLAVLCGGVERAAQDCTLEVGVPVQPMLANPSHALDEVEKMMSKDSTEGVIKEAIAEWKYDGMRCQAHCDGETMKLFSRHLLDTTEQFPDAIKYILDARFEETVTSFIVDAEIVGVADQGNNERLLPFQVLSTRRGTKNTDDVKIKVFVFDIVYLNGASLLERSLWERHETLRKTFQEGPGFAFAAARTLQRFDQAEIDEYLAGAVEGGAEGLMVKLTGRRRLVTAHTNVSINDPTAFSMPVRIWNEVSIMVESQARLHQGFCRHD